MKIKLLLTAIAVAYTLGSCVESQPCDCEETPKEVPAPDIIISLSDADTIYKDYGSMRAELLEELINKENPDLEKPYEATRFVTVNYKELKQYLQFIEQESKEAGVTPKGLRFYFAKYPKGKLPSGKAPVKAGAETVFVNPVTSFSGIKGDISYAIKIKDGKKTAVTVGSLIDKKTMKSGGSGGDEVQSLSGNTFQMPPPPKQNDPNDFH